MIEFSIVSYKILIEFITDVMDYASLDGFVKQIDDIVKDEGLNVVLNNAGVYLDKGKPQASRDDLMNTFEINSVAPIMLTRVSRFDSIITKKIC